MYADAAEETADQLRQKLKTNWGNVLIIGLVLGIIYFHARKQSPKTKAGWELVMGGVAVFLLGFAFGPYLLWAGVAGVLLGLGQVFWNYADNQRWHEVNRQADHRVAGWQQRQYAVAQQQQTARFVNQIATAVRPAPAPAPPPPSGLIVVESHRNQRRR